MKNPSKKQAKKKAQTSWRRQQGVFKFRGEEERHKIWCEWDGAGRVLETGDKQAWPNLLLNIATGGVKLPAFAEAPDVGKCVAKNPNWLEDEIERALKEGRPVFEKLAGFGLTEAKMLLERAPRIDVKNRLRAINAFIAEILDDDESGLPVFPIFVERIREALREIGERDFHRLPPPSKEAILAGEAIHPLALKEAHRPADKQIAA